MRARALIFGLVSLFLLPPVSYGVRSDYAPAKVLDVQQRTRDRMLLYQVNTPIMTEDPYVTMSLDVNGTVYEGEFLPHTRHDRFPGFWKADETVFVRIDKHFLYLKREDFSEAKFLITRKSHPLSARESH